MEVRFFQVEFKRKRAVTRGVASSDDVLSSIIFDSIIYENNVFLGNWVFSIPESSSFYENMKWRKIKHGEKSRFEAMKGFKHLNNEHLDIGFLILKSMLYHQNVCLGNKERTCFIYEHADKILNVGIKRQTSGKRFNPHTTDENLFAAHCSGNTRL